MIGTGPWYNARLQEIAAEVEALHENGIPRLLWGVTEDPDGAGLVIDENGGLVPLTEHDIVTGSTAEGTLSAGRTCLDWTSAHATVSCTEPGLAELRGAGRFYCFAID